MRIAPLSPQELRDALDGDAPGAAAESWRLLREDVRALAPPPEAEFERRLHERLRDCAQGRAAATRRRMPRLALSRRPQIGGRQLLAGAGAGVALCALCALVIAFASGVFNGSERTLPPAGHVKAGSEVRSPSKAPESSAAVASAPEAAGAPAASNGQAAPFPHETFTSDGRVQEQSASITLAAPASEVQAVAGAAGRLATGDGGYVISSQVDVQREGAQAGEATLSLSIPSARLAQALTALGRLAPVRSQSESLQDITNAYEAAHRALADASAERAALLRALAKASTQGQIESLRQRLSLAGGTITRDKNQLQSVSRRAESSRVEVSVLAAAHARTKRSTLARGLDDAGHVLAVVLVGLLIALAVLVPLGVLGVFALLIGRRWRRWQREQALDRA